MTTLPGWFVDRQGYVCHTSKLEEGFTFSVESTNVVVIYDKDKNAVYGATFWDDLESLQWCLKWCGATEIKYR